ncbi:MAG: putative transposase [Chlamydiales bacterium]
MEREYACIFIDAFYFPIKRATTAQQAIFVALAITPSGHREILGYWIPGGNESASNWEEILRNLKKRGFESVDFIIADGLTGIQGAILRSFPRAKYQYCILHATRTCLNKVRSLDKKAISANMKKIYQAENVMKAKESWLEFQIRWQKIYPKVIKFWRDHFKQLIQFMVLPHELRQYVYTTNWVESSHKEIKRRLKVMEQFHSEQSAEGILYLLYKRKNENYVAGINHWKRSYAEYKVAEENGEFRQVM